MIQAWHDYNEQLARENKLTRHGEAIAGTQDLRVAFFRSNDFLEPSAAAIVAMHSPYIVCEDIDGIPVGTLPAMAKRLSTKILFLARAADNMAETDALEAAQQLTYDLMSQFIARYLEDRENHGSCGPFRTLKIGRFIQIGPRGTKDYGWQLSLEFSERAPEYSFDASKWLS